MMPVSYIAQAVSCCADWNSIIVITGSTTDVQCHICCCHSKCITSTAFTTSMQLQYYSRLAGMQVPSSQLSVTTSVACAYLLAGLCNSQLSTQSPLVVDLLWLQHTHSAYLQSS